jgi:hypothetical protein
MVAGSPASRSIEASTPVKPKENVVPIARSDLGSMGVDDSVRIPTESAGFAATPIDLYQSPPNVFSVVLSPGVREPAVLYDPQENLSVQQAEILADLTDDFIRHVEDAAKSPDDTLTETWDRAQEDVDSQYRNIFGEAAYNLKLMEAAIADLQRAGDLQ